MLRFRSFFGGGGGGGGRVSIGLTQPDGNYRASFGHETDILLVAIGNRQG